ncbi:hypothetical protein AC739_15560 [Planococcus glaciei]|uniref:hypothetical protein n=1 Tax=Planococcus glaciei TaxID=459472 RepID=UPI00069F31EC|nr:hypothetical protein [Planococcus glaciei]KOF09382.1 hypothetical protein AC739_15560 [Planococcus glaciei]
MSIFKSSGRKSAAIVFGNLNHTNNNRATDLKNGTTRRYQQFSDAHYAAEVLVNRLDVAPHSPKYQIVRSKED